VVDGEKPGVDSRDAGKRTKRNEIVGNKLTKINEN